MIRTQLTLLATALLATAGTAQIKAFGGDGERKTSVVMFFDTSNFAYHGGYNFTYGAPDWKAEYDEKIETAGDQKARLGKDDWSTLDTSVPLTIGGVQVPAGQWYLGLGREDGKYFMMVMSADTCRKNKVPPSATPKLTAKINVPLTYAKVEKEAEQLHISAVRDPKELTKATLRLHWGTHQLTAPIVANLDKPKLEDASADK